MGVVVRIIVNISHAIIHPLCTQAEDLTIINIVA